MSGEGLRSVGGSIIPDCAAAAREVALAHYPALPLPMIAEAVAAVVPDPLPGDEPGPGAGDLRPVGEADLAQALSFAMRFDATRKPPTERQSAGGGGR